MLAALLFGALAYGLTELFLLRFQTGEVYPPYSSLRTDPLGAKAYYEALEAQPDLDVRRNYRAIVKLHPDAPVTLLYAGTPHQAFWSDDELRHVEGLAVTGTRVVITFTPIDREPSGRERERADELEKKRKEEREKKRAQRNKDDAKEQPAAKPDESKDVKPADKKKKQADERIDLSLVTFNEVAKRWGFEFKYLTRRDDTAAARRAKSLVPEAETEPSLSWHSALHFGKLKDGWRTLYACDGKPVIIERRFGEGSIVLAADSYFLSNEALRNERAPRLLAWLAGSARTVVFDEDSHGVSADPGVATLVRKYGLHGVAAGLLLIAGLFVWKNGASFMPALDDLNVEGDLVIGKEAEEGFINLLRRSIAPGQLLTVCAEEWKKAFDHTGKGLKSAHLEKVLSSELARPARERNPVAAYQTISQELSKTK
jgi:hypothetical protein